MTRIHCAIVAVLACVFAALTPLAHADKHDSNSLHKFGKAIQYPFRKAATNTSITAHRATGQNSVVHRRNGDKTYRSMVTPNGRIHRKYRVGHKHPKYRKHL